MCSKTCCASRRARGQGEERRRFDDRAGRDRSRADLHLVEARLAADPARGRGDEVPLRDQARVEGAREVDGDRVVGPAVGGGVAGREGVDRVRVLDQALRAEEACRELVLVAGRAHRHGDVHRGLAGARGTDRQGLLAAEAVLALLDGPGAVRGDRDAGRLPLDGDRLRVGAGGVGHAGIVAPACAGPASRHRCPARPCQSRHVCPRSALGLFRCRLYGSVVERNMPPPTRLFRGEALRRNNPFGRRMKRPVAEP